MFSKISHLFVVAIILLLLGFGSVEPAFADNPEPVSEKVLKKEVKNLKSGKVKKMIAASEKFEEWGPKAAWAFPQILEALDKETSKTKIYFYRSLISIEPENPALHDALFNEISAAKKAGTGTLAVKLLGIISPTNERLLDVLIGLVIEDKGMGMAATDAIIHILSSVQNGNRTGPQPGQNGREMTADEVLQKILASFDQRPFQITFLVDKIGPQAKVATPHLLEWLETLEGEISATPPDEYFSEDQGFYNVGTAFKALKSIDPANPTPHPVVIRISKILSEKEIYRFDPDQETFKNFQIFVFGVIQYFVPDFVDSPEVQTILNGILPQASEASPVMANKILEELHNSGFWSAETQASLIAMLKKDLSFLYREIVLFKLADGKPAPITSAEFSLLQGPNIVLVDSPTIPERIFAREEEDHEFKREFLLTLLDHPLWHKRIGAILGLGETNFRDPAIINAIITQWDQNHKFGNVAIIQSLDKLETPENGVREFLLEKLNSKNYPQLEGELNKALEN